MYRDESAHAARAHALIAEIADLERQALQHQALAARLAEAKRELDEFRSDRPSARRPGLALHVAVFALSAVVAGLGYLALLAL
jgi:hypothetical protein